MIHLTRQALLLLAEQMGAAFKTLDTALGDTNKTPAARIELEAALIRLRGSTLFHDTDTALGFATFGTPDPVGLGLQSTRFTPGSAEALPFPVFPTSGTLPPWNPGYYGPPCPEGFGLWWYDSWAGYRLEFPSTAGSFSNNYNEPSPALRLNYNTPLKYQGGAYSAVPLYERARWLSFYNNTGAAITSTSMVTITLTADDLSGVRVRDSKTGAPLDVGIMYHAQLVQGIGTVPSAWGECGVSGQILPLSPCAFNWVAGASQGDWVLQIQVPAGLNAWNANYWWHVVFYFGSRDSSAQQTPTALTGLTAHALPTIKWTRKNFFARQIDTRLNWAKLGIEDPSSGWLIAQNRSHFSFIDGQYSAPQAPARYPLFLPFPAAPTGGVLNSLTGYASLPIGCAIAITVCVKPQGSVYESVSAAPLVLAGPLIGPDYIPADWKNCPYFPPVPIDYIEAARLVIKRAPGSLFGLVESSGNAYNDYHLLADGSDANATIASSLAIVWSRQSLLSFGLPPLGDESLSGNLLGPLLRFVADVRTLNATQPVESAAFSILVTGARVPVSIATSRGVLADPAGQASKVFRGLLKTPVNPDLKAASGSTPLAIPFSSKGIALINALAGAGPSTELMRLSSDILLLTGVILPTASPLELYMEVSSACSGGLDAGMAGTRLGLDYTLRLELIDQDENRLTKDWFVMASQYFLTPEEYARRVKASLTTVGYFTQATLSTIDEFRLQGYAGIVPDLMMGNSVTLRTRVVSPPDDTKVTEDQFIANLKNQGQTDAQITEAILQYLESGGEFYTVDLHQYSNTFTNVRSAGISAASYTYDTNPYWSTNVNAYFQLYPLGGLPSPSTLYADSFTIAPSTALAQDLEQYGAQAQSLVTNNAIGTPVTFNHDSLAFQINLAGGGGFNEVGMRLAVTLDTANTTGTLTGDGTFTLFLCQDNAGSPGSRILTGSTLAFTAIATTGVLQEYRFEMPATLAPGTLYWLVLQRSNSPGGGTITVDANGTGTGLRYYRDGTGDWLNYTLVNPLDPSNKSYLAGNGWYALYHQPPAVLASFNRNTSNIALYLPPPNDKRTVSTVYKVEGHWNYTCLPLSVPQTLSIFPRAVFTSGSWQYVPYAHDIFVCVRLRVGAVIVDKFVHLPAGAATPVPITLGPENADAIVFMCVAKTLDALHNGYHGAPPGDRLVLRSV